MDLLYSQEVPDSLLKSVDAVGAVAKFHNNGNYLALGRSDGLVCIYDVATMNWVQILEGHVKTISDISWSGRCRYLLSASRDWNVIIWDLKIGEKCKTVRFDAPVTSAQFHPRDSKIIVVTLQNQAETILVDLRPGGSRSELVMSIQAESATAPKSRGRQREFATQARFLPDGSKVAVGSSTGSVYIFDVLTKECLSHEKVCGPAIKGIDFDQTGSAVVINCGDRSVRIYAFDTDSNLFELQHKIQDVVNSNQWTSAAFSRNGEFVAAGAASSHKSAHAIHIWDRVTAALLKVLSGPIDALETLAWHPARPLIASVSDLGFVHYWGVAAPDRWAAYAADFVELDENIEYVEAEDEFDVVPQSELDRRKLDEDKPIDIGQFRAEPDDTWRDMDDVDPDFQPILQDDAHLGFASEAEAIAPQEIQVNGHAPSDDDLLQHAIRQMDEEETRSRRRNR